MRHTRTSLWSVSATASVILGFFGATQTSLAQGAPADAAPVPPLDSTAPPDDKGGLAEVVVTARKREESLQRVPVSITAMSAEELKQRSVDTLAAASQGTPNFTFGPQAQGGRSGGVAYIRGVGQRDTQATYDPAVGIYIDGVYLGRMQGNDLDMLEVERVEVLRGPQGTLFGKNTSGGAINIITARPDLSADSLAGRLQLTGGSRDRRDALGRLDMPLVTGKAALRVSALHRRQDGFGTRIDGQDMGNSDRDSGRVSLLLKPGEAFSALWTADVTSYDETNAVMNLVFVNPTIGPIAALNALTPAKYDSRWVSADDFFSNGTGPNSSRGTLWGTSLTLDYEAPWARLKSISAYRHEDVHNDLDPDNSPVTVLEQLERVQQHQLSQELQATDLGTHERWNWVSGLYYFREIADDDTDFSLLTPLFGSSRSFSRLNHVVNDSFAGYGEVTFGLTSKLKLGTGLRYTHDRKRVERSHPAFPSGVLLEPNVGRTADSDDVSPRLVLDYQWTPTVMTYVSAAKGYKGGGFNGRASSNADFTEFDPEVVWTGEIGLRTDLFDERMRFNTTAFYSRYSDLQLQINGSTIVNGAPAPFNVTTNIPRARVTGGEAELVVAPVKGLTLTGSLGLIYARYVELPTDAQFVAARLINRDSRFVQSPQSSLALGAQYATHLSAALDFTGRIDYARRSSIYYDPANSPLLRQKPYGLLNARLTIEHARSGVSLSVFGTNLTDEHYIVGGFDDATVPNPGLGFAFTNFGPPREYGVSAQLRF